MWMSTEDAQYSTPLAVIKAMLCVEHGYTKGGCVIDYHQFTAIKFIVTTVSWLWYILAPHVFQQEGIELQLVFNVKHFIIPL